MGCRASSFAARVAAPLINPFLNFKTAESSFLALDCPSSAVFEETSITAALTVFEEPSITAILTVLTDRKTMLVLKAIMTALDGVQWWSAVLAIGFKRP